MLPEREPLACSGIFNEKIAVIRLGHVCFCLAVAYGEKRPVVRFDISAKRISELKQGGDFTCEVSAEELAAVGTNWNFLPFKQGLAGGHTKDVMGPNVAAELVKSMIKGGDIIVNARVRAMGFTSRESCPEFPNTRVIDVVKEVQVFGFQLAITDGLVDSAEAEHEYGLSLTIRPGTTG